MNRDYVPFTQAQREGLMALSFARRSRNIYGDLGPRCIPCSGLGYYAHCSMAEGQRTARTMHCGCEGSGIDLIALEREDREKMWSRIVELESILKLPVTSLSKLPKIEMSRQYWMEQIAWAVADGTAIASSVTETIVFPNVTFPANLMNDGRTIYLYASGKYSTLGSGTVSHVFKLRWGGVGGTVLATTPTITLLISMTNAYFDINIEIQTRVNGSSGSVLANGVVREFGGTAPTIGSATGAPAISPITAGGQTAPAAVTADLTADTALSLTGTHGANSASNTLTGMQYTLSSKN